MSIRSHIWPISAEARLGRGLVLALLLFLGTSPGLLAQETSAPAQAPSEVKIEVLDVTTGSGSKSQAENSEIKIEVLGDRKTGQTQGGLPQLPEEKPAADPAKKAAAQASGKKAAMAKGKNGEPAEEALRLTVVESLEQWRYQILASYNYNIISLPDPFLPIKEVRGTPEDKGVDIDPNEDKLPPILRLELNQLKLVAITVLSGGRGAALASFEDGAGNSYILRNGERIGRRQGRITSITADTVIVEEPPGIAGNPPRVTDIRLNIMTSTDGLTRGAEPAQGEAGAQ